jgi:hypothetical protein
MKIKPTPSRRELLRRFQYDPKTGKLFYYGTKTEAGYARPDGRVIVCIDYVRFRRSRIIWTMVNGKIPNGMLIDHEDRDPSNDKIENLRIVTHSANMWNQKLSSANTSGFRGVVFDKQTGLWMARCKVAYKMIHGGRFRSKEEAAQVAARLRRKHHGKYAAHP